MAKRLVMAFVACSAMVLPAWAEDPATGSEIVPDELGVVTTLPEAPRDHWVWVSDRVLRHNLLFDGDTGTALGTVDVAWSLSGRIPLTSKSRGEFYVVESVYARGHRGPRTDLVTIYDAATLAVLGDVEIPPIAAETGSGVALADILDGGDFLVVFNQSPASVSVVDLRVRKFAGSIDTAGCASVYPTGPRSFGMLCGDGTALHVRLDDTGAQTGMERSEPFFDVVEDPLTEKGVRIGDRWLFASFEGNVHDVQFAGEAPTPAEPWPLFSESERDDGWRIGGVQHLALHRATGRLYSIVHRGGPGSHKDPGTDIWVYDISTKSRVQIIVAPSLILSFVRPFLGLERASFGFRVLTTILSWFPGPGVHSVVVTQDDEPLLFVRHSDLGALGVLDARTGAPLREIEEIGISGANLGVP